MQTSTYLVLALLVYVVHEEVGFVKLWQGLQNFAPAPASEDGEGQSPANNAQAKVAAVMTGIQKRLNNVQTDGNGAKDDEGQEEDMEDDTQVQGSNAPAGSPIHLEDDTGAGVSIETNPHFAGAGAINGNHDENLPSTKIDAKPQIDEHSGMPLGVNHGARVKTIEDEAKTQDKWGLLSNTLLVAVKEKSGETDSKEKTGANKDSFQEIGNAEDKLQDDKPGPKPCKPPGLMYDGCDICPWQTCKPGIIPACENNDDDDYKTLESTLTSFSVDRDVLKDILTTRTDEERRKIANHFQGQAGFGTRVKNQITGPGNRFQTLMAALATPLHEYYAEQFHGLLTNLEARVSSGKRFSFGLTEKEKSAIRIEIVQMLATLTQCLKEKVKQFYKTKYGLSLADRVDQALHVDQFRGGKTVSDEYITTITNLINLERGKTKPPPTSYLKTTEKFNTLKTIFFELTLPQIKALIKVYNEGTLQRDLTFVEALPRDEIYNTIIKIAMSEHKYFAEEVYKILSQGSVNHDKFIRLIRSRIGTDLGNIMDEYQKQYNDKIWAKFEKVETTRRHYNIAMGVLLNKE